jgi:hypothetical protein
MVLFDPIHHVQIHLDENIVVVDDDDDDEVLVKMIVIENVLTMDNIFHNNQDMCLLYTVEHDDV